MASGNAHQALTSPEATLGSLSRGLHGKSSDQSLSIPDTNPKSKPPCKSVTAAFKVPGSNFGCLWVRSQVTQFSAFLWHKELHVWDTAEE